MEFFCADPNARVRGANVRATLDALRLVPNAAQRLMSRHRLVPEELTPDNWVSVQRWLDALKEIQTQMGTNVIREVGAPRPYPDLASQPDLRFVFGMTVDAQNRLWLTSPATLDRERTRVIAYDLASNAKVVDHELERGVARFGQDLRVTPDGKTLLFADTGAFRLTRASLVVVDIATWSAREVLSDALSAQAQDWVLRTRGEPYRIGHGLLSFQVGLDGITLDRDGHLFFAAMSNDTLYKVPLADVLDPALSPSALAARVERVGAKPASDGIETAPDGSVLVTDVEHGGVARLGADGELRTLVKLDRVIWADGVYLAPNGDVYLTDSAIPAYIDPLLRPPSLERLRAARPYHLYRFRLPG